MLWGRIMRPVNNGRRKEKKGNGRTAHPEKLGMEDSGENGKLLLKNCRKHFDELKEENWEKDYRQKSFGDNV